MQNGLIALVLGLAGVWSWVGLASCHSDRVTVNAKDPQSPQYAYRQDELALLSLMADDVQELERKKQYATIYDDYTSPEFKTSTSRRRFLIITNCVETFLGGMDSDGYDPHDLGFRRESLKGSAGVHFLDVLNRKVHRMMGLVDEQLVFVPDGLNFKLNGLYWISKDKQFLQCVAESPTKEQEGQPEVTNGPATENAQTAPGTVNGSATGETKSAEAGTAATPATENNVTAPTTGTETKPGETPTSTGTAAESTTIHHGAAPATPAPAVSPVQEMKPAEAHKTTAIHARPAGAGAVIDQRPTPVRTKTTNAEDNENAQNHPPIPSGDSSSSSERHRSSDSTRDSNQNKTPIPSSIPPLNAPTPPVSH